MSSILSSICYTKIFQFSYSECVFVYYDRCFENIELKYWDCVLDLGTKGRLLGLIEGLIRCHGELTCSMIIQPKFKLHEQTVFTRIALPEGREKDFESISGLTLNKPPGPLRLNTSEIMASISESR